jgi:ribosomal protein S18 acetylase RimI-like enzyme
MSATLPAITIRPARRMLADATALLAVERRSLGDSPYTPEEALTILRRPEHHAYLALAAGRPVGFCSSFETPTDAGPRLELDMLGVHPDYRGRGVATSLLRAAMAGARARGVRLFRGTVAADNLPSQRAFEGAGLRRGALGALPYDLTVYQVQGDAPLPYLPEGWAAHVIHEGVAEAPALPPLRFSAEGAGREVLQIHDDGGHTVALAEAQQVHSLSYRGLWLERWWAASPRALLALALGLVERARGWGLDEVGYLAPHGSDTPEDEDEAVTWVRAGYRVTGRYYVYTAGEP